MFDAIDRVKFGAMRKPFILLAVLMLAAPASGAASLAIGPVAIGDSLEQLQGHVGCNEEHVAESGLCNVQASLGDIIATLVVRFNERRKVISIAALVDDDDGAALLQAAVSKFGKPDRDARSTVQNKMGTSLDQRVVTWQGGTVEFTYRLPANLFKSRLMISTPESIRMQRARQPKAVL